MFHGPPIDDPDVLEALPVELSTLLYQMNGYVAYYGGLHVRGACLYPEWHSLRAAWWGARALHRLFPSVQSSDIPFAEDALGDQYLLRNELVHRLSAEIGLLKSLEVDLASFDAAVRQNPVDYLNLEPLQTFRATGGVLAPGELLEAYPPYVFKESAEGVSLRAIPTSVRMTFLADLARSIREVPNGTRVPIPLQPSLASSG